MGTYCENKGLLAALAESMKKFNKELESSLYKDIEDKLVDYAAQYNLAKDLSE